MSRIRGSHTKPERLVRSLLHRCGFRFRVHRKDLPGRPDIVLPKHNAVILVHGCFWHRHAGCRFAYTPKSRLEFWEKKFSENVARDRRNANALASLGWRSMIVWECETKDQAKLRHRLIKFLNAKRIGVSRERC